MRGASRLGAASSAPARPNPANASLRESDVPVSRPKTPFRKRFSSMVNLSCGIAALLEPRRAVFVLWGASIAKPRSAAGRRLRLAGHNLASNRGGNSLENAYRLRYTDIV